MSHNFSSKHVVLQNFICLVHKLFMLAMNILCLEVFIFVLTPNIYVDPNVF